MDWRLNGDESVTYYQGWGQIHEYLYLNAFLEYLYLYFKYFLKNHEVVLRTIVIVESRK